MSVNGVTIYSSCRAEERSDVRRAKLKERSNLRQAKLEERSDVRRAKLKSKAIFAVSGRSSHCNPV